MNKTLKEYRRDYYRKYREENKEELKKYRRDYYREYREKIKK